MILGMYIMATELISSAYFMNPSYQSVCLYVYPPHHYLVNMFTQQGGIIFCVVCVISKESRQFFPEIVVLPARAGFLQASVRPYIYTPFSMFGSCLLPACSLPRLPGVLKLEDGYVGKLICIVSAQKTVVLKQMYAYYFCSHLFNYVGDICFPLSLAVFKINQSEQMLQMYCALEQSQAWA
jgi:hypothetical protein